MYSMICAMFCECRVEGAMVNWVALLFSAQQTGGRYRRGRSSGSCCERSGKWQGYININSHKIEGRCEARVQRGGDINAGGDVVTVGNQRATCSGKGV